MKNLLLINLKGERDITKKIKTRVRNGAVENLSND